MTQTSFTTRVITPENGFVLTQAGDVDIKDRIFSDKVFLGVNDNPSNWKEITEAEAEALKAELREQEEADKED